MKKGHRVELHTLPGRHWKWRMHGAASTWSSLFHHTPPEILITTDMCDVAQLRGLMPPSWAHVKVVIMYHENQLTFPWSPDDPDRSNGRDLTYAFVNISSGLAADEMWFNSKHHMDAFLLAAGDWIQTMPKPHIPQLQRRLAEKSHVLHLGLEFQHWKSSFGKRTQAIQDVPVFLWNQRWSLDKGTDRWMAWVDDMLRQDIPGHFVVLGESFERTPEGWNSMRERMGNRCLHWGFVNEHAEYIDWLWKSDIAPIHPRQEYFGMAIVEAMRCGVTPWVPHDHAYPETTPAGHRFVPQDQWIEAAKNQVWRNWPLQPSDYMNHALSFSWDNIIPLYDQRLADLTSV